MLDLKGIKNIIFDLGGVILNINPHQTKTEFEKMVAVDFQQKFESMRASKIFLDLELGNVSAQEFRDDIKTRVDIDATDQMIDQAWNAMILDIPPEHIDLLKDLHKNFRVFLLSNTNEIHIDYCWNQLKKDYHPNILSELFEKEYYSNELHMRKPRPNIFKHVLKDSGLIASETLFLDDNTDNIRSAKKLGIRAVRVTEEQGILQLLKK